MKKWDKGKKKWDSRKFGSKKRNYPSKIGTVGKYEIVKDQGRGGGGPWGERGLEVYE